MYVCVRVCVCVFVCLCVCVYVDSVCVIEGAAAYYSLSQFGCQRYDGEIRCSLYMYVCVCVYMHVCVCLFVRVCMWTVFE